MSAQYNASGVFILLQALDVKFATLSIKILSIMTDCDRSSSRYRKRGDIQYTSLYIVGISSCTIEHARCSMLDVQLFLRPQVVSHPEQTI